jgi:AcrR family transcriptional regulator
MAEKGYRGTSIAQVAARAGISQSGLLHHFPSKQALLIAVIDYRQQVDSRTLEDADGRPLLGWAAFDGLLDLVRKNTERPQVVRMFATLCAEALDADHPAHEWIQQHYASGERTLADAIEAGIAEGTMRPDMPPATIAHLTVAIMDGLQLQWLSSEGALDMAGAFEAYVDHLKLTWGATP